MKRYMNDYECLYVYTYVLPPNKSGTLFNIRQDATSRAAYKCNIRSMVSLYVSTSGLVPAYKYNMNSMVSLLLELQSFSLQECN